MFSLACVRKRFFGFILTVFDASCWQPRCLELLRNDTELSARRLINQLFVGLSVDAQAKN